MKTAAQTTAGYNKDEAERRYLKALNVDAIDTVFPGSDKMPPPPPDPKVQVVQIKEQGAAAPQQAELAAEMQRFIITLQEEQRMNNGKLLELEAKAQNEAANAQTEQAYAQVALMNTEISRIKAENEHIGSLIEARLKAAELLSKHHIGMKGLATGQEARK